MPANVIFDFFARAGAQACRIYAAWGPGMQNLHGLGPARAESRAKSLQEDKQYIDLRMRCMKEARFARLTHMGGGGASRRHPPCV